MNLSNINFSTSEIGVLTVSLGTFQFVEILTSNILEYTKTLKWSCLKFRCMELSEKEQRMFEHAAHSYGAIVCGGTADDRVSSLGKQLCGEESIVVDFRSVSSEEQLMRQLVTESSGEAEENIGTLEARKSLEQVPEKTILLLEFDSAPSDVQQYTVQFMKGVIEVSDWDGLIGYTADDCEAVVRANFDLSGRVRSWNLEDH